MAVCKGGYEFLILKGPIGVMVDEGPLHQLRVLARSTPRDGGPKKVHTKGYGSSKKVHTKGYGS